MKLLCEIGYPITRPEKEGITSPVISVSCEYKLPTTYDDSIEIEIEIVKYTGVRLSFSYVMKNSDTNVTVAVASSSH